MRIQGELGLLQNLRFGRSRGVVGKLGFLSHLQPIIGHNKEKLFKNILAKVPAGSELRLQDLREDLLARKKALAMAEMKKSLKGIEVKSAVDEGETNPNNFLNKEILKRLTQMGRWN